MDLLIKCKTRVQQTIKPMLKNLAEPQPNLGIGAGGDPIKRIDLAAEGAIADVLEEQDVSFTLVSEESGIKRYGSNPGENFVTTDPIDGTTNLLRGIPFYATSIAVSTEPTMSTVHTALVEDLVHCTTYTAEKGKGAHRNGCRITSSNTESLKQAVIGIDLNTYKVKEIAPRLTNLIQSVRHIRHLGANALEICHVADGTADAFIDIRGKLRTTDIAAAYLITTETDAEMTTPQGKPLEAELSPTQKIAFIVTANRKIRENIVDLLEG